MNLLKNPEIRRNAWLQFSKASLIAVPLVLLMLVMIVSYKTTKGKELLPLLGLLGFVLVTTIWGARQTFNCVVQEVTARTWDWQRMSAMSAWEMMLGKLFGAPLFVWFIGACCLTVTAFFSGYVPKEFPLARLSLLTVVGTIMLHAICLAGGTAYAGANYKHNGIAKWVIRIMIVFWLILPLAGLSSVILIFTSMGDLPILTKNQTTQALSGQFNWWFGLKFNVLDFLILSCVFCTASALYIAHSAMAQQMKAPHRWWAWLLLPLGAGLWFGGVQVLLADLNRAACVFLISTLTASSAGLPLLLINPLTQIHLSRLNGAVNSKKSLRELFELLPSWIPAVMLSCATSLLAAICLSLGEHSFLTVNLDDPSLSDGMGAVHAPTILVSSVHFLSVALLLSIFTLNRNVKHPIAWAVFTAIVGFFLLPLLLRTLGLKTIADFLDPTELSFYASFAYYTLQCALLFAAVIWVVKRERQN